MEILLIPVALVALFLFRAALAFMDHERIRRQVDTYGGKVLNITWDPFRSSWVDRNRFDVYTVTVEDAEGKVETVYAKTSALEGVFFAGNRDEPMAMDLQAAGRALAERRRRETDPEQVDRPTELLCPRGAHVLERVMMPGLEVDRCGSCRLWWFDRLELEAFLRRVASDDLPPFPEASSQGEIVSGGMCPRCRKPSVEAGTWHEIPIGHCAQCAGILLDATSLEAIRKHVPAAEPSQSASTTSRAERITGRDAIEVLLETLLEAGS